MEGNPLSARPLRVVQRAFAASRLAHEWIATAYEVLLPLGERVSGLHEPSGHDLPCPGLSCPPQPVPIGGGHA